MTTFQTKGTCSIEGCEKAKKSQNLCSMHYERLRSGQVVEGAPRRRANGTGSLSAKGYIYKNIDGVLELEHRMIAAVAIGRLLKGEECVHHVDENGANNTNENLVLCPNNAYHQLLHRRTRALDACGNANWLKCNICGEHSAPTDPDMWHSNTTATATHRSCNAARIKALRARKNEAV